jgi:hypothetical protein
MFNGWKVSLKKPLSVLNIVAWSSETDTANISSSCNVYDAAELRFRRLLTSKALPLDLTVSCGNLVHLRFQAPLFVVELSSNEELE